MSVLQLEGVTKRYGDKTAVSGISLNVERGEIFGLLGGNGAGKTTTMRMVLGLIYPDEGRILYHGKPYSKELIGKLGYLPEERGLYPKIKVSDQILYLAELRGVPRAAADKALKGWLDKFEVPEYYGKKVEELSKGNQQKIQFIAAVIHNPDILVLDEAFSGLDPVNVELLKATVLELREQGKTILFSSHRMDHVEELCRNICILHKSNTVLKGSLRDIKASYPKERVLLETSVPVTGLDRLPGVAVVKAEESRYELRVSEPSAAQQILQAAMAEADVHRFQILEPTLTEIFIKKVGDGE
ncbi:ABC transporter ATP-binding protein [Gorillibacterium sp. sgz500922]|uniref:ABC transporter ATP-binding protein n=1 Tax=Gorillibacterium sp. sgz500922 TaxID=3446694 RepID=UPI003F678A7A